jgi:hypothetical protein
MTPSDARQQPLPLDRCARCGRPLVPLLELARVSAEAAVALDRMRLVMPERLTTGIRTLAAALPCWAGVCCPPMKAI